MRIFLPFLLLIISLPTQAQDYKTVLDLPDGATLVTLSATERQTIGQDLLVATLRYEAEDKNPRTVQNEINTAMKKALDKAKSYDSAKAATLQYNIYEYDINRGKKNLAPEKVWKGEQGLMVKGKDQEQLLKLVGEMQDLGLKMSGLNYQVSPELLEKTRDDMLEAALTKLTSKANRTAKAIGKSKAEMKKINVDMGGGYHPQPRYAAKAMMMSADSAESMAAPVASAGEDEITLTVNAEALLR